MFGVGVFEREKFAWRIPAAVATSAFALMMTFIWIGHPAQAVPVGIASFFIPLAGMTEPIPRRILTQFWTLAWVMLGTLAGGLLSADGALVLSLGVAVAGAFTFFCGFAGAAGPHARLAGVLTLVAYSIFMGGPDTPVGAFEASALLGLGGVVQIVVIALVRLRAEPVRVWALGPSLPSVVSRLRARFTTRDDFVRHGSRLALTFMVATVIGQWLSWPHEYWIAMTVAWVSLPDVTGTATRAVARVLGTVIGIVVVAVIFGPSRPSQYGVAAAVSLGVVVIVAFFRAQYALAVVGVTVVVAALMSLSGDPLGLTEEFRVIDTVIAAVLTVVFSFIWRAIPAEKVPVPAQ